MPLGWNSTRTSRNFGGKRASGARCPVLQPKKALPCATCSTKSVGKRVCNAPSLHGLVTLFRADAWACMGVDSSKDTISSG